MATHTIQVFDPSGNLLADVSSLATQRELDQTRNASDTITLEFNIDALQKLFTQLRVNFWDIFYVGRNEIRWTRNSTVISAGQIVDVKPVINGDTRTVSVIATGWFDLLANRYTDAGGATSPWYFLATDAGQIAWSSIVASQALSNGNFGLTLGTIQTSMNRDRTDYSYKNIKDLITELSQVINGFDFGFSWDKKFNVYYPKIGNDLTTGPNAITLTYPGNISSLTFERNGQSIFNEVLARGSGTGSDAFLTTSDDTVSQGKYKLRQEILELSDVSDTTNLQQQGDSEVSLKSSFIDVPSITLVGDQGPEFGQYGIGDIVPIRVTTPDLANVFSVINGAFRIDNLRLTADENNVETVVLNMMNR